MFELTEPVHARLSAIGYAALIFAIALGILFAIPTTYGVLHQFGMEHGLFIGGPGDQFMPVPIGLLVLAMADLPPLLLLRYLRRGFVLAKTGRLTSGVVVFVWQFRQGYSRGSLVYYDFLDDRGTVTRSRSNLQQSDSRSLIPGSRVNVLYLPGQPRRNALELSMGWKRVSAQP